MTGLQSCPLIYVLSYVICQNPILERLDLSSMNFHLFRLTCLSNEAQRELSYRYPRLWGTRDAKAWCSALESIPNRATYVQGLLLAFPLSWGGGHRISQRWNRTSHMYNEKCVCKLDKSWRWLLLKVIKSKSQRIRRKAVIHVAGSNVVVSTWVQVD